MRVLATGCPIGTLAPAAAALQFHAVTSTAASVGPYRLCNSTPGSFRPNDSTSDAGSASPLQITRRRPAQARPTPGCSRNACSIDGTKCIVVTPRACTVSARQAGSLWPSGRAITRRATDSSGRTTSHTATATLKGVFCSTVAPGPLPNTAPNPRRPLPTHRYYSITPSHTDDRPEG